MRKVLQGIMAGGFVLTLGTLVTFWTVRSTHPSGHWALPALYGALGAFFVGWLLATFVTIGLRHSGNRRLDAGSNPKTLARRVRVELATIDGTLGAALGEGRWWDVQVTGLPSEWWNRAADVLPARVHDVVAPAYVEANLLNQAANGYYAAGYMTGGRKQLSADEAVRLEQLQQTAEKASAALRRYAS